MLTVLRGKLEFLLPKLDQRAHSRCGLQGVMLMRLADTAFCFLFVRITTSFALNPFQSRSLLGHAVASCLSRVIGLIVGIAKPCSTADTSDAACFWRPKINMLGRVAHESVMRPAAGVQRTARLPCAPTPLSDVLFLPCWCLINFRRTSGGHASVNRCEPTSLCQCGRSARLPSWSASQPSSSSHSPPGL